jgi:hypothetical protein
MLGNWVWSLAFGRVVEMEGSVIGVLVWCVEELLWWRLAAGNFRLQIPHKVTQTQIRNSPPVAGLPRGVLRPSAPAKGSADVLKKISAAAVPRFPLH